ncbi:MAG: SDR family NAD(P)-dependent oxidoreductase [Bacillota bacterium]
MKIAIVTGASSGLGRETAVQLAQTEAGLEEIWVISRRKERLQALKKELENTMRIRVFGIDLIKDEGISALEAALKDEKPDVRILVNAAGFGKIAGVEAISYEDATGMVTLNCRALVGVTQLVLPYMGERGRIIEYASGAAFLPMPGTAVYAATKAFVLSYSRALNEELRGRKISVTAVCPGPVDTEFFDVAGIAGTIAAYKKFAMADTKRVAALALRDSAKGKSVSVYGGLMKAARAFAKIVPHGPIIRLFGRRR